MPISLIGASLDQFVQAVFDHDADPEAEPWYFDSNVRFEVEPEYQVSLLTRLFRQSEMLLARYSNAQIEAGLWCIFGGVFADCFTQLIWKQELAFEERGALVASVYDLYHQVLARAPNASIDFIHADDPPRRFETIDYMATDLLVDIRNDDEPSNADAVRVCDECLRLFERLLNHPAPVAQYAALHGLGHLPHARREEVIAEYIRTHPDLTPDQRTYASEAQKGDVL